MKGNDLKNNINYENENTIGNISKINVENKKSTLFKSEEDENLNNNYKRIDNDNYGDQTNEISNNNNVTDTYTLIKKENDNNNISNEKEVYGKGIKNKGIYGSNTNYDNTNDIPSDNGLIISKNENNQHQVDLFEEEPVLRSQGRNLKNTSSNDDKNSLKESKLMLESQNKEIIKNEEQPIEVKENNKEEEKKEAYEDGEKIRKKIRLMDRLNKARARSCGKNDEKAKKSNDILMKAKLLESVLGHLKKPEDLNNNNNAIEKESIKNDNIGDNINRDHSSDMHIIQKKKKKKNNIPFDG